MTRLQFPAAAEPGVKWLKHEADHSPPSNAEVPHMSSLHGA